MRLFQPLTLSTSSSGPRTITKLVADVTELCDPNPCGDNQRCELMENSDLVYAYCWCEEGYAHLDPEDSGIPGEVECIPIGEWVVCSFVFHIYSLAAVTNRHGRMGMTDCSDVLRTQVFYKDKLPLQPVSKPRKMYTLYKRGLPYSIF